MNKIFWWVDNEGNWIALDKSGHFILHAAIVKSLRIVGVNTLIAFTISQVIGFLYEWIWDCHLYRIAMRILFNKKVRGGASWKDLVANFAGGVLGMII